MRHVSNSFCPVREGGFGLSSVQVVSTAAWYSALANSFNRIRPLFDTLDSLTPSIPFVKYLSNVLLILKPLNFLHALPSPLLLLNLG